MKKNVILFISIIAIFVGCCLTCCDDDVAEGNSSISGFVLTAKGLAYSGMTVTLSDISSILAKDTTDSNGHYSFHKLRAGKYTLTLTAPYGYALITESISVTLNNNDDNTTDQNFTIIKTYAISGTVKTSIGGIYSGATLTLSGTSADTTTTASDGTYTFRVTKNGSYTVTLTTPANYTTSITKIDVEMNTADTTGNDFTIIPTYTISGVLNTGAGGTYDGATITLGGDSSSTVPTANSGAFSFSGLFAGNYFVKLSTPSEYYTAKDSLAITLSNADSTNQNFTIWQYHTISGTVTGHGRDTLILNGTSAANTSFTDTAITNDENKYSFRVPNGTYNITLTIPKTYITNNITKSVTVSNGDSPGNDFSLTPTYSISGIVSASAGTPENTIISLSQNSTILSKDTTASDGIYSFSKLVAGDYKLTLTYPSGYFSRDTVKLVTLSDADSTNQNFAIHKTYSLTGTVKTSIGGTYSGAKLTLGGDSTNTATSASDGTYTFSGLINGSYTVTLTVPDNHTATITKLDVNINDADTTGNDFTIKENEYSLSGKVFVDYSGTTSAYTDSTIVTLSRNSTTLATDTTDSTGAYSFNNLLNGTYTVALTLPTGHNSEQPSKSVTISSADTTGNDFLMLVPPIAIDQLKSMIANNEDVTYVNTSKITNMDSLFYNKSEFNQDISKWNVSNVTSMIATFSGASKFNQNIGDWDVSNVTSMSGMFVAAFDFNQDIGLWKVENVTNMYGMFFSARKFNGNIGNWGTSTKNVKNMSDMFNSADNFNQNLNSWDTKSVTNMNGMFNGAENFNDSIGNWDVSNVTDMKNMFNGAKKFNQYIGDWKVDSVTNMSYMFYNATNFNDSIGNWDVSNVENMSCMFQATTSFNQNLNKWNTGNVKDMSGMFQATVAFNDSISNWDVKNVENMKSMFCGAEKFNQDISGWTVSKVTDMSYMFYQATYFNQNLSGWTFNTTPNHDFYDSGANAWTLPKPTF